LRTSKTTYFHSPTACTIAISVVHSKLDYCNSLYYKRPRSQLSRLQQIQNSLARNVVKASKSSHITPILRCLHWLRITERMKYNLLSLTYKVLTTTQPPYHSQPHLRSMSSQYSLFICRYSCSATFIMLSKNEVDVLHVRLTELHAAHQNLRCYLLTY